MTAYPAEDFFSVSTTTAPPAPISSIRCTETAEDKLIDPPRAKKLSPRGPRAKKKLSADEIREYMPMVRHMVSQLLGKIPVNVLREDLLAAGAFGLVTSMLRDGPERSPTFEWYARIRIRGAIMDELRNQDWLTRRARMHVQATFGDPLPSERSAFVGFDDLPGGVQSLAAFQEVPPNPLELMEAEYDRKMLSEAIESLPERERHILMMHYFRGIQFKALAEEMGVSMPRISQLHARAVTKLRQALRSSRSAS
jgi:RNA polymerase sigma factor for flagellar operon FliA